MVMFIIKNAYLLTGLGYSLITYSVVKGGVTIYQIIKRYKEDEDDYTEDIPDNIIHLVKKPRNRR